MGLHKNHHSMDCPNKNEGSMFAFLYVLDEQHYQNDQPHHLDRNTGQFVLFFYSSLVMDST